MFSPLMKHCHLYERRGSNIQTVTRPNCSLSLPYEYFLLLWEKKKQENNRIHTIWIRKTWAKHDFIKVLNRTVMWLLFSFYTALHFYREIMNRRTLTTKHVRFTYGGVALCNFHTIYSIHLKDMYAKETRVKQMGNYWEQHNNTAIQTQQMCITWDCWHTLLIIC